MGGYTFGRLIKHAGGRATLYMRRGHLVKVGDWLAVNGHRYRVLDVSRSRNSEPKLELELVSFE